jgi:riboflavin biosynthesis pyrimidine reductase
VTSAQKVLANKVLANIVVASNGMTTLNGSSRELSNSDDRTRFHALRANSSAIVIGGSTFRSEPYKNVALPLYVASHQKKPMNSTARFFALSPSELVKLAASEVKGAVLIEGGANFLKELIAHQKIDEIYITRVQETGDGHLFDFEALTNQYSLISMEENRGTRFELWTPRTRN